MFQRSEKGSRETKARPATWITSYGLLLGAVNVYYQWQFTVDSSLFIRQYLYSKLFLCITKLGRHSSPTAACLTSASKNKNSFGSLRLCYRIFDGSNIMMAKVEARDRTWSFDYLNREMFGILRRNHTVGPRRMLDFDAWGSMQRWHSAFRGITWPIPFSNRLLSAPSMIQDYGTLLAICWPQMVLH